jgi:hypothetical protein
MSLLVASSDMGTDIAFAIANITSGDSMYYTFGVVSLTILGSGLFLQVLVMIVLMRAPLLSKETLLAAVGCGPALMIWRTLFGDEERRARAGGLPSVHALVILQLVEVICESVPALFLGASLLAINPVERWSTLQLSTLFSSLLGIVFTLTIVVHCPASNWSVCK